MLSGVFLTCEDAVKKARRLYGRFQGIILPLGEDVSSNIRLSSRNRGSPENETAGIQKSDDMHTTPFMLIR